MYTYVYIYMYTCVCVCTYMYIVYVVHAHLGDPRQKSSKYINSQYFNSSGFHEFHAGLPRSPYSRTRPTPGTRSQHR